LGVPDLVSEIGLEPASAKLDCVSTFGCAQGRLSSWSGDKGGFNL